MTESLVGRRPEVSVDQMIAALVPPPHFDTTRLDTYAPDPQFPSQAHALATVSDLANALFGARLVRRQPPKRGLYLDGGFGVGKTHLLAGLAHAGGKRAAFATFVEYTALVGALGFQRARDELQRFAVVCIDEFELDDPGDTVMMSRLMRELTDAGVVVVATSNTLPDALGEGRFAAQDFLREIQALSATFEVVTIDGEDYRHRDSFDFPNPATQAQVRAACEAPGAACEDWKQLITDLANVHPSRMGPYVSGIATLGLLNVSPLEDQNQALRVVTLVDRLYDHDVRIHFSGEQLSAVFTEPMLRGGFRKKYLRALSRMHAMAVDGASERLGS